MNIPCSKLLVALGEPNGMLYNNMPSITDFIRACMHIFPFAVFAVEEPVYFFALNLGQRGIF